MRRRISLACTAYLGHCERITPFRFPPVPLPLLAVNAPRFVSMAIPQVWRRDGCDGVHAVPQDSGNPGNIWLLVLDAVLLLHRRQTAVRDDWPVRPPDVQPDVPILVRTIHFKLPLYVFW
jgi:hypothetical protein